MQSFIIKVREFLARFSLLLPLHTPWNYQKNYFFQWSQRYWRKIFVRKRLHCVKSVRIRSFYGPYFPAFGLNTDQKNSKSGYFPRSVKVTMKQVFYKLKYTIYNKSHKIRRYVQKPINNPQFCWQSFERVLAVSN